MAQARSTSRRSGSPATGINTPPLFVLSCFALCVRNLPTILCPSTASRPPVMETASFYPAWTSLSDSIVAVCTLRRGIFASPAGRRAVPRLMGFADVRERYGAMFPRAMRMSESAFDTLVDTLRPHLPTHAYSPAMKTAMALWYMGGGSYIDIAAVFGCSVASFYNSLWSVVDAINAVPALKFSLPLADPLWRMHTAAGFQARGEGPFDNIIGALDGIAVKQEQPSVSSGQCLADHYSRKGFYALNTQAICNASYEFTWMSCTSPGSVHDASAFSNTKLGRRLMFPSVGDRAIIEMIADGYCIAADEAYGASELLATPWPGGGGGDVWRDSYNFHQSSSRIHIEQAFGMLVWRWGVFWRPLRVPFCKRPSLIRACFKIHNFCRRVDCDGEPAPGPYGGDGDAAGIYFSENDAPDRSGRRRDRERSDLRVRMTARMETLGLRRPYTPAMY